MNMLLVTNACKHYWEIRIILVLKHISRLTIVSREAKKNQRPLSELFTGNTAKKLANALAKPPWQLAPSYYSPNTFLLHRINKPTMVEIGATVLKYWPLRV